MFNQKRKKNILIGYIVLILSIIGSMIYLTISENIKENTIKIGTSPDYPPLEYKENGRLTGFDIELVQEVAKNAGLNVEIKEIGFDNLITSIQNGKIDMIASGFGRTPEREKVVDFSTGYLESGNVIMTTSKPQNKIDFYKDKKVAILTGSIQEEEVKKKGFTNIKNFDNAQIALKALETNNVDVVYTDELNGRNVAKKFKKLKIANDVATKKEEMCFALVKNKPNLKKKIDISLKKLYKDKTLEKLSNK